MTWIKDLETGSPVIGSMALARQLPDFPLTNDLQIVVGAK
jgi:hypothetical protein